MSNLYETENNILLDCIFLLYVDNISKLNQSETEDKLQKNVVF